MFKIFIYLFHLFTVAVFSPKVVLALYFGFKIVFYAYHEFYSWDAVERKGGNQ